eukprot:415053_1
MAETHYKGRRVLERLVYELGMFKELISDNNSLQIDCLLHVLLTEDCRIANKNSFWQRIGFTVDDDPQLISLIKKHRLLMAETKYNEKTVLQRLFEELEMYEFREEYWEQYLAHFTDTLYATECGTLALKEMSDDDSDISFFRFTTNT